MLDRKTILDAAVTIAKKTKTVDVTRAALAKHLKVSLITISYYVNMKEVNKHLFKALTK